MLEGLEAVEMKLSEVINENETFRIDSEYFKKEYVISESIIKSNNWNYLQLISKSIVNFGAYSLCNNIEYIKDGVPFLNVSDIEENLISLETAKLINATQSRTLLNKSLAKNEQVLLTIAGTIGKAAVCYGLPEYTNSNQAIANITALNISPFYLSIYLNSKYGKSQTKRLTISSVQPNLLLTQVKKIKISITSKNFQSIAENIYKSAHKALQKSKTLYKEAEHILLKELDLLDFKPSTENIAIKKLSQSLGTSGRLDAEYYQKKYEEIENKIKEYKGGYQRLSELAKIKNKNFIPKNDIDYKYIELSNVGTYGEVSNYTIDIGLNLPTRARRIIEAGDIIVSSIEGSLSSVALISKEYDSAICSTGFYVVLSKVINSYTLLLLFKSLVCQMQLKKVCSGTILTSVNSEEFTTIIAPIIRPDIQNIISSKIQQSFELRKKSQKLLDIAKEAVEMVIEKSEEIALEWLNDFISQK